MRVYNKLGSVRCFTGIPWQASHHPIKCLCRFPDSVQNLRREYSEVLLPEGAPEAWQDRATLWNAVEAVELLLDEPTEGIQPNIVQQIEDALLRVRTELGVAILIVEQNLDFAWSFADRYFVMQRGRIGSQGRTADHSADEVAHLVHI